MDRTTEPVLSIRELTVALPPDQDRAFAIEGIDLDVLPGEILCVVGESGSGKSVTANAIMRLLHLTSLKIISGKILFEGQDLLQAREQTMRMLRGSKISMIFQEPMSALNPLHRVGDQIDEVLKVHGQAAGNQARARILELLHAVRLPDPELIQFSYPHHLSGGQRQRVMIAMALALEPAVLIADEPTTALDVTTQAQILSLIKDVQRRRHMSVLFVTHDFGVVAEVADRVIVMKKGRIVETGLRKEILSRPQHPYTQGLLAAVPRVRPAAGSPRSQSIPLLEIRSLSKTYSTGAGSFGKIRKVNALEGVDLTILKGETIGVVGESGSGKSTLGKAIVRLMDPDDGHITFSGKDIFPLPSKRLKPFRQKIQMIFQDPFSSLNPRHRVRQIICEGMWSDGVSRSDADRRMDELLELVGLDSSARRRYPHEFSGGQRQRIGIARALALEPELIIADEAVSALDVSVQAQVLDLLRLLRDRLGLTMIFITHDLRVAAQICDRIVVMEKGRIVEMGDIDRVFSSPAHAYTKQLLDAVPGRHVLS